MCGTLIQVAGSVSCQNRFGRLALLQLLNAKHVPILHKTCDKGTDHRTVSGKLACFSNAKLNLFSTQTTTKLNQKLQGQSQETHVAVNLKIVPAVAVSDQLQQNQSIVE